MQQCCGSEEAHKQLLRYDRAFEEWFKQPHKVRTDTIRGLLAFWANRGISDCKRFLLRVWQSLSRARPPFYNVFDNYWDACGVVSGELLKEDQYIWTVNPDDVFGHWLDEFRKAAWAPRSHNMKGFIQISDNYTQWDACFWRVLNYYHGYSRTAALLIQEDIPKPICNATNWLVDIWHGIAKNYKARRSAIEKDDELEGVLMRIAEMAGPLLELISIAWDSGFFDRCGASAHFRAMFFYAFPVEYLTDQNDPLTIPSEIRERLEKMREQIENMLKQPPRSVTKDEFLQDIKNACDLVLANASDRLNLWNSLKRWWRKD